MSFSFDFIATRDHADAIVEQEHAPEVVKEFLRRGLAAFKPDSLVRVRAYGHLYSNDYQRSTGDLLVEQVTLRAPKQ